MTPWQLEKDDDYDSGDGLNIWTRCDSDVLDRPRTSPEFKSQHRARALSPISAALRQDADHSMDSSLGIEGGPPPATLSPT